MTSQNQNRKKMKMPIETYSNFVKYFEIIPWIQIDSVQHKVRDGIRFFSELKISTSAMYVPRHMTALFTVMALIKLIPF